MYSLMVFVLALTSTFVFSQDPPVSQYPKWPTKCTFTNYVGKRPLAEAYSYSDGVSSEQACMKMCDGDERCGMYGWGEDGQCSRYQHSVLTWNSAGLDEDHLLRSANGSGVVFVNTGSKNCRAVTWEEDKCVEDYKFENGRYTSGAPITRVYSNKDSLTEERCQRLCTVFSGCRSVWYTEQEGRRECVLQTSQIYDVGVQVYNCSDASFASLQKCGTYDRYCSLSSDGSSSFPYQAPPTQSAGDELHQTVPTTSLLITTGLILLARL